MLYNLISKEVNVETSFYLELKGLKRKPTNEIFAFAVVVNKQNVARFPEYHPFPPVSVFSRRTAISSRIHTKKRKKKSFCVAYCFYFVFGMISLLGCIISKRKRTSASSGTPRPLFSL